jgi:nitroreductase
LSAEQVVGLVSAAILAPSGGNCQPWRFVWSAEGRLRCVHDVGRSASFLDFEHRAAYMALGAAVENVAIAAAAMGLEAEVTPFPGPDREHVCDVAFSPRRGGAGHRLAPFIAARATNRRLGPRRALGERDLAALREALEDPATELQALTEPSALDEMGRILGAGDRFRFFDERLYREMMAEMRWNPRQAEETRDGVDIATLELGDVDEAGLRLLSSWPAVRFLRSLGMGGALEDLSRHAVDSASALAIVTCRGTSPLDYFRGGRAVQRVWLTATSLGLAVQPMSSLPYLFARLEEGTGFEPRQRDVLRGLRERYARLFRVGAGAGELLLFRLARAEAPTVRSLRRPLEAVLSFA